MIKKEKIYKASQLLLESRMLGTSNKDDDQLTVTKFHPITQNCNLLATNSCITTLQTWHKRHRYSTRMKKRTLLELWKGGQNRSFRFRAVYLVSRGTSFPFFLIWSFFFTTHSLPLPFLFTFCFFLGLCRSDTQTCKALIVKSIVIQE